MLQSCCESQKMYAELLSLVHRSIKVYYKFLVQDGALYHWEEEFSQAGEKRRPVCHSDERKRGQHVDH